MSPSSLKLDGDSGSNLLLLMFALCAAENLGSVLSNMFNLGVGIAIRSGVRILAVRSVFMAVYFLLLSVAFVLAYQLCHEKSVTGAIPCVVHVLLICVMAMSPWFCDHLARVIFFPFRNVIRLREDEFKYVDFVFVGIYVPVLLAVLLTWKLVT